MKSWRSSFCLSKVLGHRASPSSRGPYSIKSCFAANATCCVTLGSAWAAPQGAIKAGGPKLCGAFPAAGRRGHAVSAKFLGLVVRFALSVTSAIDFTSSLCCLTDSWSDKSSAACFCVVASRKVLVAVTASFSLLIGPSILSIILSMNRLATVDVKVWSAWARRRKATDRMAVLASGGSLNESVVVRSISASLELVSSSQLSIQPLLSSQDWASLAEDTGLGVAVTWASKLGRGERLRVLCDDVEF